MDLITHQPVLASTQSAIGWALMAVLLVGFAIYVFVNIRSARAEIGSEIELAPNRKPYYDDEQLEGRRLDRTLGMGLAMLALVGVSLPLYWLAEPVRQTEAAADQESKFVTWGERLYTEGAQCINCHGPEGKGGVTQYTRTDSDGKFIEQVNWQAPALNNVLYRYSWDEVIFILEYGRPGTPMPAWGAAGGGPLTEQQLDTIVYYLQSIQLPAGEAMAAVDEQIAEFCAPDGEGICTADEADGASLGEFLFNLGYDTGFSGGSYSCGRCHTEGWSYGQARNPGGGAFGFSLTDGRTIRQFPTFASQVEYVSVGSVAGKGYGRRGQSGAGMMPGFGVNPNAEDEGTLMHEDQVMYTQEQIEAIVEYEREL